MFGLNNCKIGGSSISISGNVAIINGKRIEIPKGNVSFINGKLYVNGKEMEVEGALDGGGIFNITIEGNVEDIDCNGSVTVNGNVKGDIDCNDTVTINGDMEGDIDSNGNVIIRGTHKGSIDCNGSVITK